MKPFKLLTLLFLIPITFFSCSKTEKLLIKNSGQWNIDKSITTTIIDDISTMQSQTDAGIITFSEDGTGVVLYTGGFAETFVWTAADDSVTITYDISTTTVGFIVLDDSTNDYQHWSGGYNYTLGADTVYIESDLTMSRLGE